MSLQEHLRQLSPGHKRQLLARLLQSHSAARDGLPYSYDQEQAWSLHRSAPDSSRANLGAAIYLPGAAVSGLHSALADVIAAHESLRLAFRNDSLRIRPFLADECRLHPASFDLRPLAEARRAEAIHRITREQLLAPFDLNEAPLFRLTLLQLEPAQYLLFLTAHEIVSDAWSLLILLQEISDRAHAYGGGFPANDRPAAPAFSRVAAEMRSRPDDDGRFQYWLERLRDAPEPARLPGTNGLADKRSILGRVHSIEVPATTYAGLRSLSSETGDSLVPVLFAAYAVWLHLRTGAEDLVVGVPAPNREQPERLGLVGPIGGYLPIRLNLSGDPTFAELQGAAFPLLSEALGGAAPSVAELARSLAPERLVDRHPLFRHTFFLQDFSQNGTARRDLKAMASWQPVALAAQHDLSLTFLAGPNQLVVRAEYAADLFDAKTVRDWFEQFLVLLAQLAAAPERPISTLRTAEDATPRRDGAGVTQSQPHPVPAAASVSVSRQADVSAPLPPPRKAPLESPRPTSESSAGQGEDPIFEVLHAAWREFLPVDVVGIDQNFFELGGHSLLAMQVHSLLIEALGVEAPLRLQFEAADLGDLAQRVREEIPNVAAAVESARAWLRKRGANGAARTTAAARATAPTREPAAAPSPAESRDAFGHARSDGANGALPSVPAPREPAAATGAKSPSPGVPLGREVGRAPASFAQQRLWFLDQLDPGSSFYNLHFAMKFAGPLDRAALRGALNEIVSRHEPLRTTFAADDSGTPVQVIREPFEVTLPREDLRLLNASDRSDAIRKRLMEEVNQPFNLATGPLIRARLLRTAPQEHLLALSLHHIVVDVWSIRVLVDELQKLYQNFGAGRPSPLPPLKTRYRDFAEWQHEMLRGDQLEELVGYWRKQLDGAPAVLELPADRPRPPFQSFSGAMLSFEIDPQTVHGISELARQERATPFMVLLAGFAVVLSRHAHRYDLVIGAPIITRGRTDLEHLIGLFSNTLVLRLNLSGEPSFRELVQRARSVTVDAYAHQDLPFEKLVDELQPERNLGHNPLFQVMFSYDVDNERDLQAPDDTLPAIHSGTSKFDFGLYCTQTRQGLVCAFEYNTDLFDSSRLERMAGHIKTLLAGVTAAPDAPLSMVAILPEAERRQLAGWSRRTGVLPAEACTHLLFQRVAQFYPDRVAASLEGAHMTFEELDKASSRLAHFLRRNGVDLDVRVGLSIQRSFDMLVALLAILKAGGAYVPIDPAYPQERIAYMLRDASIAVLLTDSRTRDQLPALEGVSVFCLDRLEPELRHEPASPPETGVTLDNLVYVIYTSGSTGRPKGVAMTHRAVADLVAWQARQPYFGESGRTLQFTSLSFDVSFQEIFSTWLVGGTMVLVTEEDRRDPNRLAEIIGRERVERIFQPFVATQQLCEVLAEAPQIPSTLRLVISAGEQLQITPQVSRALARMPNCRLLNQYGPSETHIVTEQTVPGAARREPVFPPIGKPVAGATAYVLNEYLQPQPIGVPGEIYIGGSALARGYLNQPGMTAEKFLPDPFSGVPGARMYRTGDLGRVLPSGSIQFEGRIDDQIKIRGFRVEPGEIEAVLSRHPAVNEAVVVARRDPSGEPRIIAYYIADGGKSSTPAEIRDFLHRHLPEYMLPFLLTEIGELPLTPSGKIDRRALPDPNFTARRLQHDYVPPSTPIEASLVEMFKTVLRVEAVGVQDSFFELGGHSLLATRLVSRIREELRVNLAVRMVFEAPTVAELAIRILGVHLEQTGGSDIDELLQSSENRPGKAMLAFKEAVG